MIPLKHPRIDLTRIFFRSLANDVAFHYPDRKGTIASIKCLRRGEILAIMPDVYFKSDSIISVPFFGRLLRAMPGMGFFSIKSGAPIIPLYPRPARKMGFEVNIGRIIDPEEFSAASSFDEDDAIFNLTSRYFEQMESVFAESPYHWNYWDSFFQRSTIFQSAGRNPPYITLFREMERLALSLGSRLKASPDTEAKFYEFHKKCESLITRSEV